MSTTFTDSLRPTTPTISNPLIELVVKAACDRHTVAIVSDERIRPPISADDAFALVRNGDEAAFGAVYDELAPKVYGTVLRVLRDPAMSEEVSQEVFVELWQTAGRFDPSRASLSTWVTTMARRRAVDRVRREQSQRDRIEQVGSLRNGDDDGPDTEVVAASDASAVRAAVAALPEDQRDVIRLSFIEGRAHGDIAQYLDLPLGTVKGRVRGGLKKLKSSLGTLQ